MPTLGRDADGTQVWESKYRMFQKELYKFGSLYPFIQRTAVF
jgi:hypothetical protein